MAFVDLSKRSEILGLDSSVLVYLGVEQLLYSVNGVEQRADAVIGVERGNDKSNVFCHINLGVPGAGTKLLGAIYEVGGEDLVDSTVVVRLVDLLKTVAEQTEGCEYENSLCALGLELSCDVKNGFAGCDNVVNDYNVLTLNALTKVLVSLDGVLTVLNNAVITALLEGTQLKLKN